MSVFGGWFSAAVAGAANRARGMPAHGRIARRSADRSRIARQRGGPELRPAKARCSRPARSRSFASSDPNRGVLRRRFGLAEAGGPKPPRVKARSSRPARLRSFASSDPNRDVLRRRFGLAEAGGPKPPRVKVRCSRPARSRSFASSDPNRGCLAPQVRPRRGRRAEASARGGPHLIDTGAPQASTRTRIARQRGGPQLSFPNGAAGGQKARSRFASLSLAVRSTASPSQSKSGNSRRPPRPKRR